MDLAVHASYPYLLKHDDAWFCVPEIADSHEIALFRSSDFPGDWRRVATLVDGFDGLDPTVFRHEDLWWLLCTDRVRGPNTKLWGWYATDLLGPWLAHGANPLKTDVRSARPAGTPFVYQGVLYRPAQDGSRTYGGAVTLNRSALVDPYVIRRRGRRNSAPGSERSLPGRAPHDIVEWKHDRHRWKADALHLERLSSRMARSSSTTGQSYGVPITVGSVRWRILMVDAQDPVTDGGAS